MIFREIYGYLAYAFRPEVPWFSTPSLNIAVSDKFNFMSGESSSYTSFRVLFVFACSLVILYIFVSIPAI